DAVVDLRPRPPDARRDEVLRALGPEAVHQSAPAHGRLNRLNQRLAAHRRAEAEVDLVSRLDLMPLPLQTGHVLLGELGDESQISPLAVETASVLLFLAIGERQLDVESRRTFEQLQVAAVERARQLLAVGHVAPVVK